MSGGAVKCWGNNTYGGLGDGTTKNSASPVTVRGLSGKIAAIAVGGSHACALTVDGSMQCWGKNVSGQLGGGFTANSNPVPVQVKNINDPIRAIALGNDYTCVLTGSGGVKCWGWNYSGQLGNGTNTDSIMPVDVIGLSSGVAAISARASTTCALMDGGAVKCWGWNATGQLGDGTSTDSNVPVNVKGLTSGMESISVGFDHACALTDKGGAKCWGDNLYGQLGNGTTSQSEPPVDVSEPASDFLDISAGDAVTCARTKAGGVKCWGLDTYGFLGKVPPFTKRSQPVDLVGLSSGVAFLEVGLDYGCTISVDGIVKCWGSNSDGQLGDGTHQDRSVPGVVINL
jgi:alpha-tubulin suppressor-like RCC1 family protein